MVLLLLRDLSVTWTNNVLTHYCKRARLFSSASVGGSCLCDRPYGSERGERVFF
jgi:hypothetical protein